MVPTTNQRFSEASGFGFKSVGTRHPVTCSILYAILLSNYTLHTFSDMLFQRNVTNISELASLNTYSDIGIDVTRYGSSLRQHADT